MANILWTGREYYSLENCLINTTGENFEIDSVIIGLYEDRMYHVEYYIKTNNNWETQLCEVKSQLDDRRETLNFCSDGRGAWTMNGKSLSEFDGYGLAMWRHLKNVRTGTAANRITMMKVTTKAQ